MLTPTSSVMILDAPCHCDLAVGKTAHHRDFPEIWAEGMSIVEAIERLKGHLLTALESAQSDWRRESIIQAISDLEAYPVEELGSSSESPALEDPSAEVLARMAVVDVDRVGDS